MTSLHDFAKNPPTAAPEEREKLIPASEEERNERAEIAAWTGCWLSIFSILIVAMLVPPSIVAILEIDQCASAIVSQRVWLFVHVGGWVLINTALISLFCTMCTEDIRYLRVYGLSVFTTFFTSAGVFAWAIVGVIMIAQQNCNTRIMLAYVILDFIASITIAVVVPIALCCRHCA